MTEKKFLLVLVVVFSLVPSVVFADGMIIIDPPPPDPPLPDPFALEVQYHRVDVQINNNVAQTDIDQMFYNPTGRDLEGTYLFPIPDDAAISQFLMYVEGEELQGEVKDADEARKIYEDYVRQNQDPALLEYVGQDMFQARIYPIEADSEKRVKLGYTQELKADSGIYKYVYPLNTEKFSASTIGEVAVEVEIDSTQAIKSIYSPSHNITIRRDGNTKAYVSYTGNDVKPNTDFILYYTVSDDPFGADILTFDEQGQKYFMLLLAPDYEPEDEKVIEKDVVFVIDKSGSMAGKKIEQAKGALDFALNHLNTGDRFNMVVFSDTVDVYKQGELIGGTDENIAEARDFVSGITDGGGTNIYDALESALGLLATGVQATVDRPPIIIFLTDGQPTVGNTDINAIIDHTTTGNTMDARLFSFGVGYDVNTNLLDKLSNQNNAISEYVLPDESIETKVSSFYSKIANPVLANLKLVIDSEVKTSELYPQELPDMFKGSQLVILGKYAQDATAGVVLSGEVGGEQKDFAYRLDFDSLDSANYFIPRLWATRRIGALLDEIRLNGEDQELVDEIIRLSKKYGIITQYTSFLVDLDITQSEEDLLEESQDYWSRSKDAYEFDSVTGGAAVNNAQGTQNMFQQLNVGAPEEIAADEEQTTRVAQRNDKTFYYQNDTWIDNDYADSDVVEIKQYSDAYFKLLDANPELGDYLSLGGDVQINFAGKNYMISAEGASTISDDDLPPADQDDDKVTDSMLYVLGAFLFLLLGYGGWVLVKKQGTKKQDTQIQTKDKKN